MTVIYSSDLFTYIAKYFQTLPGKKWQSFANSLQSMLKLVHEVPWQFAKKLVHEVVWQAPQFMNLHGNLTIWRAVVDGCLIGSFLQLLLRHYSVRFGY